MTATIRDQLRQLLLEKYGNLHAAAKGLGIEYHRLYGCFYKTPPPTTQDLIFEKMKLEVKP